MTKWNLRNVDLNLLVVLNVLLRERHITKAAAELNISQSAMSKALSRIRSTFNDPMLIRMRDGYELTDRAEELVEPLKRLLEDVHQVFEPNQFDPATTEDEFVISMLDYGEVIIGSAFMQRVIEEAPHSKTSIVARTPKIIDELVSGSVDLTFGSTPKKAPQNCVVEHLFDDNLICVVDKHHPLANKKMTLDDYLSYPHAIQHTGLGALLVDTALSAIGRKRTVVKQSPNFVATLMSLQNTPMIFSLPEATVLPLINTSDLVAQELPFEIQPMKVSMIWHKRNIENPSHIYFRELFKSVALGIAQDRSITAPNAR